MRAALTVFAKDLRLRLRDRSAVIVGVVAPLALAAIIGAAFGNPDASFSTTIAFADADGGELGRIFRSEVLGGPQLGESIEIVDASRPAEAERLVTEGEADAAIVVPQGFTDDVFGARETRIEVVRSARAEIAGEIASAIAEAFTAQVAAARLSIATAVNVPGGPGLDDIERLAAEAGAQQMPVSVALTGSGRSDDVISVSYFGPAMAIFFLYFTVGFTGRSLLAERDAGTLARLRAAPIGWTSVVAGKSLVSVVLGLASLAVIFSALAGLFGAEFGDTLGLVVLSAATVVSLLGVQAVVQLLAKTQEQADNWGSVVAISFSLVGGSFFQIFALPDVLQKISYATPNGWAIRGYTALSYDGAGVAGIVPNVLALLAIAAVTGAVAMLLARRTVHP